MSQPFDMKAHEERQGRNVRLKDFARLPHDVTKNILALFAYGANRSDIFQTCVTCSHFEATELTTLDEYGNTTREICKLAGLRPPAKVIADGCKKYDDGEIPF